MQWLAILFHRKLSANTAFPLGCTDLSGHCFGFPAFWMQQAAVFNKNSPVSSPLSTKQSCQVCLIKPASWPIKLTYNKQYNITPKRQAPGVGEYHKIVCFLSKPACWSSAFMIFRIYWQFSYTTRTHGQEKFNLQKCFKCGPITQKTAHLATIATLAPTKSVTSW